jgi:hypothetical protein
LLLRYLQNLYGCGSIPLCGMYSRQSNVRSCLLGIEMDGQLEMLHSFGKLTGAFIGETSGSRSPHCFRKPALLLYLRGKSRGFAERSRLILQNSQIQTALWIGWRGVLSSQCFRQRQVVLLFMDEILSQLGVKFGFSGKTAGRSQQRGPTLSIFPENRSTLTSIASGRA